MTVAGKYGELATSSTRQLALLWGGVAAALLALAPLAPRFAGLLPACPLKGLTGVPCPGCGTTRAALALGSFDPVAAFAVSPLAAAGWIFVIVGGLLAGGLALAGVEPPGLGRWMDRLDRQWSPAARAGLLAAIALNWLYLLYTGA